MNNLKKYPRTYHLPWSEGATNDDKIHKDIDFLLDKEIVITTKMDGENFTIYRDYFHARSLDGNSHWSQSFVKKLQSEIGYLLPEGWRICGENLYATHSIKYKDLKSYCLIFSIWNENNLCLSWDETLEWCQLLNLTTVPELYRGKFSREICDNLWHELKLNNQEGYVVRNSSSFLYEDFSCNIAKFVRKNHVTTNQHWKFQKPEKNILN